MHQGTKWVAIGYGAWALLWVAIAAAGYAFTSHGEYGVAAHLTLSFTGLPLGLLSWGVSPHGSVLATGTAGIIGFLQWCILAELNARYDDWKRARKQRA